MSRADVFIEITEIQLLEITHLSLLFIIYLIAKPQDLTERGQVAPYLAARHEQIVAENIKAVKTRNSKHQLKT